MHLSPTLVKFDRDQTSRIQRLPVEPEDSHRRVLLPHEKIRKHSGGDLAECNPVTAKAESKIGIWKARPRVDVTQTVFRTSERPRPAESGFDRNAWEELTETT